MLSGHHQVLLFYSRAKWADSAIHQAKNGEDAHAQAGMDRCCCLEVFFLCWDFFWISSSYMYIMSYMVTQKTNGTPHSHWFALITQCDVSCTFSSRFHTVGYVWHLKKWIIASIEQHLDDWSLWKCFHLTDIGSPYPPKTPRQYDWKLVWSDKIPH